MSRQAVAVAEKALLTPANIIRAIPVKTATGELATKPSPYGKLGWRNIWPAEYTKMNPRLMPFGYTYAAKFRLTPWKHIWEHTPIWRMIIYGHLVALPFVMWIDKNIMLAPQTVETLTAMVMDDVNDQRRAIYQHIQKHHDHEYFKHKGCHDGHPLGHGVSDVHVF